MRIIFSRDRAAQLDLLLRSLEANAPAETTTVIWRATTDEHHEGYALLADMDPSVSWAGEQPIDPAGVILRDFQGRLAMLLERDECVTFFCDDDVLYRPVASLGADVLVDERVLAFSLRLGDENPAARGLWRYDERGLVEWMWSTLPPHDFGYPGSIDGHTFRTTDVLRLIDGQTIENPLMLETILAHRCPMLADERPLMACYPEQALVGVPVNTVADDQRRPHGERHPQPADELNARFLAGERIDLSALDFSGVDGCLHEIPFVWRQRVEA